MVPNSNSLGEHIWEPVSRDSKMIASAVGGFMAAFVLGVRDRHTDNILIRQDTQVID